MKFLTDMKVSLVLRVILASLHGTLPAAVFADDAALLKTLQITLSWKADTEWQLRFFIQR